MDMGKVRRKCLALLLAAALLGASACSAGTDPAQPAGSTPAESSAQPSGSAPAEPPAQPSGSTPAEPSAEPAGSTPAASSAQPSGSTPAGPSDDPASSIGTGTPLPVPPGGGEEKSLLERLFVPVAVAAAVLLAAVIWLVWDRSRSRRRAKKVPPPSSRRNDLPVTHAPVPFPVYRVGNLHHIGQREEQQDSFCLSDINDGEATREKGLLAVVADGMGGLEGGAAISQRVTDTFLARYRKLAIPDADEFLYDSVMAAEKAVEELMAARHVNGGSTLVAVLLRGDVLHFISVGDSRIYLLRGKKLLQLNHEHTYGALLRERATRGEIDPEEPYVNPRRDALTAYIGMGALKRIDRSERPVPLQPGDKVLLCSDGVFNALGRDALISALEGEAAQAAAQIEEAVLAQELSNQDNFTGVILEWRDDK